MKLLLVTACLVASVFAAPAERPKRNILPGDPRYDAKQHHHEHLGEHGPQQNEVEISKALGGFTGTFPIPDFNFGYSELETEASFDSTHGPKYDIDASKIAGDSDAVKIGGSKVLEQFKSVTEGSSTLPKVESGSVVKSSDIAGSDAATSTDLFESRAKVVDTGKESSKNADETKIESKSASDESSSDASKTTIKLTNIDAKSSAKALSSDIDLVTDSLATPFFDSSFDSGFASFGQSRYNPSIHYIDQYTPGFEGFNTNYGYYNNYGGYPLGLDTYSGLDQRFKGQTIDADIPVDFSQLHPVDFTKNIPYLTDSSVVPQVQQQLFRNYSPFPLVQPTSASFQTSIQPAVKITEDSYSGISQLTDANGGYIY